jgi:hypothetical protein
MPSKEEAKNALDKIIQKSRVHLYKPIHIAEILYRHRTAGDIDLLNSGITKTVAKNGAMIFHCRFWDAFAQVAISFKRIYSTKARCHPF